MTEDTMVTVPRADIEFVVQIANRNEWSREGDRLAALLSKRVLGDVKSIAHRVVCEAKAECCEHGYFAGTVNALDIFDKHAAAALTASEARVAELEQAAIQLADAIKSGEELAVIGGLASDIAALASGEK